MKCISCKQELKQVKLNDEWLSENYYCLDNCCNQTTYYYNGGYSIIAYFNNTKYVIEGKPAGGGSDTRMYNYDTREIIIKIAFIKLPRDDNFNSEYDKMVDKFEKLMLLQ